MTDSVDTDALRVLADNINVAPAIWGHDAVRPLRAAADEIDALRARAERAEAVVAEVKRYADDRSVHAGTKNNTVGSWRIASDLHQIIARASQPASEVEQ